MNMWTLISSKRGVEHGEEALETLLQFCKSQDVEITRNAAFNVKILEQVGWLVFDSATRGNKIARSVLPTWRTVVDMLKLIKAERNTKVAAKMPVPAAQNGGEHVVQAHEKPQDGDVTWHGSHSPKMVEPVCCGCSLPKHPEMAERGRQPMGEGMPHWARRESSSPLFRLPSPAVAVCHAIRTG